MSKLLFLTALCASLLPAAETNPKLIGSPTAPVTIELFSDYQCPACKQLHTATLKPLIADCAQKGEVQIVHRDFPLPQHTHAKEAARYANAAAKIGLYTRICD